MKQYKFKLTPAYCFYNGAGIKMQKGSEVVFFIENLENISLKNSLTKAFVNHIEYIRKLEDCPEEFKKYEKISFIKAEKNDLRTYVSSLYEDNSLETEIYKPNEIEDEREAAAVLLLDEIIHEAKKREATDIHIEKTQIRFRVQNKLIYGMKLESEKALELIRRIKLLAGLNVLESKKSQDGQFYFDEKNPVFIRVSTMSVISDGFNSANESVVLRILDTSRVPLSFKSLGFSIPQVDILKNLLVQKNGLILICGPTGSGKSTTAASMLLELNTLHNGEKKIISLEDPPEYVVPCVTQIKIDNEIGNTYSECLKHVFRQDPDVLMIGEIRDSESCETAVRASMTGHLVIATLHTDSVLDSIYRLENLGVPPKILASVLRGIIIQEMNVYESKEYLLADVVVPKNKFIQSDLLNLSEALVEELFEHTTNAGVVLKTTVENLNKDKVQQTEIIAKKQIHKKKKKIYPIIKLPQTESNQQEA